LARRDIGRPRKAPDRDTLVKLRQQGMSHQEIADWVWDTTGERISRSTISSALHRAGLTTEAARYSDTIPWRVHVEHLEEYPVRMLRMLGRRRASKDLTDSDNRRLDKWLHLLDENQAVVGYDPDNTEQGFHYVPRRDGEASDGIPIRHAHIRTLVDSSQQPAQD